MDQIPNTNTNSTIWTQRFKYQIIHLFIATLLCFNFKNLEFSRCGQIHRRTAQGQGQPPNIRIKHVYYDPELMYSHTDHPPTHT